MIEVVDNGIGLSASEAKHVFEPFYRAERGQNPAGVGLGLAIARHLIDRQGGAIALKSAEGVGSTFTVRLPAAETAP